MVSECLGAKASLKLKSSKRPKGLKYRWVFPGGVTLLQLLSSFNLCFSLQGDANTAVTSCCSSAFVMLPVSDHHSWSSWKVWQMLNQVLTRDFSTCHSSKSVELLLWGQTGRFWTGEEEAPRGPHCGLLVLKVGLWKTRESDCLRRHIVMDKGKWF